MARESEGQLRFAFYRPGPQEALNVLKRQKLLDPRDIDAASGFLSHLGETGADAERIARDITRGKMEADDLLVGEKQERIASLKPAVEKLVALVKSGATYHFTQVEGLREVQIVREELLAAAEKAGAGLMLRTNIIPRSALVLLRLGITPRMTMEQPGLTHELILKSHEPGNDGLVRALRKYASHDSDVKNIAHLLTSGLPEV